MVAKKTPKPAPFNPDEFLCAEPAKPKKLTKFEQTIRDARNEAFWEGAKYERTIMEGDRKKLTEDREQLQLAQIKAVTELIKETTGNLSKCGYLIGKLNKDNSR